MHRFTQASLDFAIARITFLTLIETTNKKKKEVESSLLAVTLLSLSSSFYLFCLYSSGKSDPFFAGNFRYIGTLTELEDER